MDERQERANKLNEFKYDIWINLLPQKGHNYEEIGKAVVKALMEAKSNEKTHSRNIIVCGS